ncbi:hypothetical protein SAMN05444141_104134 [Pseudovibrio denitrificans]|uniref:Uncharacterized protein n=1 Tax=Pseudovibrio denitrificans TaxID=258256 RepID=A0A1I7BND2_9HYPH|nr:hypothetical protein [Pseudovibrio denitrificans]SFT88687.1 hypothetical protein SAMN05444141_104134 [Pseudovibrio denitrificans]
MLNYKKTLSVFATVAFAGSLLAAPEVLAGSGKSSPQIKLEFPKSDKKADADKSKATTKTTKADPKAAATDPKKDPKQTAKKQEPAQSEIRIPLGGKSNSPMLVIPEGKTKKK